MALADTGTGEDCGARIASPRGYSVLGLSDKQDLVTDLTVIFRRHRTAVGICNVQHVCISQCDYTECDARSCMQHDSPY